MTSTEKAAAYQSWRQQMEAVTSRRHAWRGDNASTNASINLNLQYNHNRYQRIMSGRHVSAC